MIIGLSKSIVSDLFSSEEDGICEAVGISMLYGFEVEVAVASGRADVLEDISFPSLIILITGAKLICGLGRGSVCIGIAFAAAAASFEL